MENLEEPSSVGRSHFSLGVGVDPSAPTATPPIHRRGIHASPSLGQRARQQQEPTAPDGKPEGEARYGAVPVSVRAKGLLRQANKAPPGVQQWGREGGLSGRGSRPNSWASSDPPSIDGGNAQDAVPKSQRSAKKENNAPKTEGAGQQSRPTPAGSDRERSD